MPPSFVALREHAVGALDGTKIYAVRYPGGIGPVSSVSDAFDTEFQGVSNSTVTHTQNKVIRIGGDLYLAGSTGIYKMGAGGTIVTLVHAYGDQVTTSPRSIYYSGLHLIYSGNGRPYLAMVYKQEGSEAVYGVRLDVLTGIWSEAGPIAISGNSWRFVAGEAVYKGRLYVAVGSNEIGSQDEIIVWDPVSQGLGFLSNTSSSGTSTIARAALVAHKGRLYSLYKHGSEGAADGSYRLDDISDNVPVNMWTSAVGALGYVANDRSRLSMWSDGTYLYALVIWTDPNGWRVYQFADGSFGTPTDVTASAITGTPIATGANGMRTNVFYDYENDPTIPDVYMLVSDGDTSGDSNTLYKWDPLTTPWWKDQGVGGDVFHSLPSNNLGGERFFSVGQLDILITGVVGDFAGTQVSFQCFGGGSGRFVKFYLVDSANYGAMAQAALVGSVTGGTATRNGNQIENVDADGVTTYTAIIDPVGSGFAPFDAVRVLPVISIV